MTNTITLFFENPEHEYRGLPIIMEAYNYVFLSSSLLFVILIMCNPNEVFAVGPPTLINFMI